MEADETVRSEDRFHTTLFCATQEFTSALMTKTKSSGEAVLMLAIR